MMKIVGFVASPRKIGNTAWTVNKILESAMEQGAESEIYYSSDLDIKPCKGCLGCVQIGKCTINDDMQMLYDRLLTADALVLGSPIYMGQMSAQAKAFTDRLFAQLTPRFSPHFKKENAGKKLLLAFTQGNPDSCKFQAYYDYTRNMFQLLEFDVKDVIVVTGTRTETTCEMKDLPVVLEQAGVTLVQK
jgi:multimeric flavodoxin WrbA